MRKITVFKIEENVLPVSLKKEKRQRKNRVYIGGICLGLPYKNVKYPTKVRVLNILLSNGEEYEIASHTIPSFVWVERFDSENENFERRKKSFQRFGGRRFDTKIVFPGEIKINFKNATKLKQGSFIANAYPFHLIEQQVGNGSFSFPVTRPKGIEWQNPRYSSIGFAKGISGKDWKLFLKAIIGLYFSEKISFLSQTKKRMSNIRKAKKIFYAISKKGQCYDGQGMKMVAIGSNLIFEKAGEDIFIVDSPRYGRALYFFKKRDDAILWASGVISSAEAKKRSFARFVHNGRWKDRAAKLI